MNIYFFAYPGWDEDNSTPTRACDNNIFKKFRLLLSCFTYKIKSSENCR